MAALDFLLHQLKHFPNLGRYVDCMRSVKGSDPTHEWANWCFLPHEAWRAIARELVADPRLLGHVADFLSVLGTWRYSQGIYRFDPDFFQEVLKSDFSDNLPSDVLLRLPEWCVFVETPGLTILNSPLDGFFAHLEDDRENSQIELRLSLVEHESPLPFNLLTFRIPLGNWNVDEAYDKFVFGIWKAKNGVQDLVQTNRAAQIFAEAKSESVSVIKKLISLLLYLCTEQPEIIDRKEPEWHPAFPRPKTIKGELRYFPATKQHVFEVVESLGQELRQQREQLPSAPTGRHVRSHFRRGHWQGYWYGPRKNAKPGERKCVPKWIPPLFVHGGADETEEESAEQA